MEYSIDHLTLDDDLDVFDVDEDDLEDDEDSSNNDRIRNFGKYVQVITVEYNGTMCAAKQLIKPPSKYSVLGSRIYRIAGMFGGGKVW